MKRVIAFLMMMPLVVAGEVSVTSVAARQRFPWNGKVDITVTISGASNEVAAAYCLFAATNSATRAALPVKDIKPEGADVGSGTTWTRRYVWNAAADLGNVRIEDVELTVEATLGVQLWENGPYWAECNVGATKPEEYGYYFWWGDTVGYSANTNSATWLEDAKYWNGVKWVSSSGTQMSSSPFLAPPTYYKTTSELQSAGYIDSTGNLVAAHDAATAHLGAPWRMPTNAEWGDLISNCDTTWTARNGVYGRLVTGRGEYSSKSIFLPAAGYVVDDILLGYPGSGGFYWSSTPRSDDYFNAWDIGFSSGNFMLHDGGRDSGEFVRPLRGSNGAVSVSFAYDGRSNVPVGGGADTLVYDAAWYGSGATAKITDNGRVIVSGVNGEYAWGTSDDEGHLLTLSVTDGQGREVGNETAFYVDGEFAVASAGGVAVMEVAARQRFPWNGKVDVVVQLYGQEGAVATADCAFAATNSATRAALPVTAANITRMGEDVGSGTTWTRRYVWNAAADLGKVKIDEVELVVEAVQGVQLWENGPLLGGMQRGRQPAGGVRLLLLVGRHGGV